LAEEIVAHHHVEILTGDRDGRQQDRVERQSLRTGLPAACAADLFGGPSVGQRDGDARGGPSQRAGVLPDAHGLETARDAVHAIVRADDGVDRVSVGGEDLLHDPLRLLRKPALDELVAPHADPAGRDGVLQHLALTGVHEVRVRILRSALDEHVVAPRTHVENLPRLDASHLDVVEG
jgi:hypothetical protein